MNRETPQANRTELAKITSRRPVVRKVREEGAKKFVSSLTDVRKTNEGGSMWTNAKEGNSWQK